MDFNELVDMFRNQSEDAPLPADFADQLTAAHNGALEPANATIEQLQATNTELDGKVKEYAVKNFELMKGAPITQNAVESNQQEPPKPMGVEALMKKAGY